MVEIEERERKACMREVLGGDKRERGAHERGKEEEERGRRMKKFSFTA